MIQNNFKKLSCFHLTLGTIGTDEESLTLTGVTGRLAQAESAVPHDPSPARRVWTDWLTECRRRLCRVGAMGGGGDSPGHLVTSPV